MLLWETFMLQLRHYPKKFAAKVVETIPTFQYLAQEFPEVPQALGLFSSLSQLDLKTLTHFPGPSIHPSSCEPWLWLLQVKGVLHELFDEYTWENQWPEADFESAMLYMRRSKLVNLPREFANLIPRNLNEIKLVRAGWALMWTRGKAIWQMWLYHMLWMAINDIWSCSGVKMVWCAPFMFFLQKSCPKQCRKFPEKCRKFAEQCRKFPEWKSDPIGHCFEIILSHVVVANENLSTEYLLAQTCYVGALSFPVLPLLEKLSSCSQSQ